MDSLNVIAKTSTDEPPADEDEYDIYKGFESDEPFEAAYEEGDEEWKILNLSQEGDQLRKEEGETFYNEDSARTIQSYATRPPATSHPSLLSIKVVNLPTSDDGNRRECPLPKPKQSHIPSLMSLKTEPPEYYIRKRYEESLYGGSRCRNSRYQGGDRKSPYRMRRDNSEVRLDSNFKFYERRNKPRSSMESRFK